MHHQNRSSLVSSFESGFISLTLGLFKKVSALLGLSTWLIAHCYLIGFWKELSLTSETDVSVRIEI